MTNKPQVQASSKLENAAKEIQDILERDGLAIEPFLRTGRNGIIPDARLIELKPTENAGDNNEGGVQSEDSSAKEQELKGADEAPSTQG
jgi:hypothetical protein